jgi:uncharacterized protein (DUF849 family)
VQKVMLTCAVTGNITKPEQSPHLPITPDHIAKECLAAAQEGAAAVHIHVRDPISGEPSMELAHYRAVVDQIRNQNRDLIINLTTGPGGRFRPSVDDPKVAAEGSTLVRPEDRIDHISALCPDVATLDLNTMNSGEDVVINTPRNVRIMAAAIQAAGSIPEIELFDSGDIRLALALIADGTLTSRRLYSFVLGVNFGFGADAETMLYARNMLPAGSIWTGFGVGRHALPMLAQSYLLGGHVRIGMEDCIFIDRGKLAEGNAPLVAKSRTIISALGGELMTAAQARDMIGIASL